MSVFIFIIIIVGLVTFGEVASKALESGASKRSLEPADDRDGELTSLREQVAQLSSEVHRLSEEQRFMTRLLESGPRSHGPSFGESGSERSSDPGT